MGEKTSYNNLVTDQLDEHMKTSIQGFTSVFDRRRGQFVY